MTDRITPVEMTEMQKLTIEVAKVKASVRNLEAMLMPSIAPPLKTKLKDRSITGALFMLIAGAAELIRFFLAR